MATTRRRSAAALAALATTLALGVAGCGDGDDDSSDGSGSSEPDTSRGTDAAEDTDGADDSGGPIAPPQIRRVLETSERPAAPSDPTASPLPSDCAAVAQGPLDPAAEGVACDEDGVVYRLGPAEITGGVEDAEAESDKNGGWLVMIELDDEAAATFEDLTTELAGTQQQMAIVSEAVVISAPIIQGAITDGKVQIAGDFTQDEARALADALEGDG